MTLGANLADRYISDRFLPDKAIDLIDEAGSRNRIYRRGGSTEMKEIDERLSAVREDKSEAVQSPAFRAGSSAT